MRRGTARRQALRAASSTAIATAVTLAAMRGAPALAARTDRPNIVLILADDLGYGDLGCYGQKQIYTPDIDRMAAEGIRFTQAYAGSSVCAPSRCCLLTGYHTGHASVRTNDPVPLRPEDVTIAEILKAAGYATGAIGKWGLGLPGTTGVPNKQGFDEWFGYLDQTRAHDYYPDYLWRNEEKVDLEGNRAGRQGEYSHDRFTAEALDFIRRHRQQPFFLYLAYTIPHANTTLGRETGMGMQVPDDAPYGDRSWPRPEKNYAAMITRMDRDVGRLLALLKELDLDGNTAVFFTSDNGPHDEGGADPEFFKSSGGLRGTKKTLYEGGIRVPFIVRWTGRVPAGTVSDHPVAFWDVLPTAAELVGLKPSSGIDGISVLPLLRGEKQPPHDYLYWERPGFQFEQAVRMGHWKAIRRDVGAPIELYDLTRDAAEQLNVARSHPDVVAKAERLFMTARTDSKAFPIRRSPPTYRRRYVQVLVAAGLIAGIGLAALVWRQRHRAKPQDR